MLAVTPLPVKNAPLAIVPEVNVPTVNTVPLIELVPNTNVAGVTDLSATISLVIVVRGEVNAA